MARISPGTMIVAIFAMLVGLGGAFGVRQYLKSPPAVEAAEVPQEPGVEMVYVPVAARDMLIGQKPTINDIVLHRLTPDAFEKSEFKQRAFMPDTQQIIGRTLRTQIIKGSVFQPVDFFSEKMGPGIADRLKPGFRAVTMSIHNIGAVEGFARLAGGCAVPDHANPRSTGSHIDAFGTG